MKKSAFLALLLAACSRGGDDTNEGTDARRYDSRPIDGAGGADGSGGGADAPMGGADAAPASHVQDVQDETIAVDTMVRLSKVFVTAVHQATNGNVTMYVQEAQGVTTGSHPYPEYAGITVFFLSTEAPSSLPAVGACLDVMGTVDEFNMGTELKNPTIAGASGCGTAPTPAVVNSTLFAMIASDTDSVTAGDQAGANAEAWEGVLIKVEDVETTAVTDTYGETPLALSADTAGPVLKMDDFLYNYDDPSGPTVGTTYTSVTGVYNQFTNYKIAPRDASDVVP